MARRYIRDRLGRFAPSGTVRLSRNEKQLTDRLESAYPGLKLSLGYSKRSDSTTLSKVIVPKEGRNKGTGSKVMRAVTNFADRKGRRVALTPSSDFGGNKRRLQEFYKRFGFAKNKDLSISETMLREPRRRSRKP